MPRQAEITAQEVLGALTAEGAPMGLRELGRSLGLSRAGRAARKQLRQVLGELKRNGEIVEMRQAGHRAFRAAPAQATREPLSSPSGGSGHARREEFPKAKKTAPRDPNLFTGRIMLHRDGYGFVVPDAPLGIEGDLYVRADNTGDAMHGDRVLARIERRRPDGRAEGKVVRIISRAHPTVVGIFRYAARGGVVTPLEPRLAQEVVLVPPGEEISEPLRQPGKPPARQANLDGAAVNVELTRFPRGGVRASGRVIEILGKPGEPGVDVEIIVRKHHLPHVFPEEVLAEAREVPQAVPSDALAGREDFRALAIVTIDGETARDFDDAVYVERLPGGHYQLQVHIADVAHYVPRGSPLDQEARLRGTSVYFPDRAIPMLPHDLSNGICSLNPREDRLVMSVIMEIDAGGRVVDARLTPGVIRSAERMTYDNVNRVLEGDPDATRRYEALADRFRLMKELALVLYGRRQSRGAIDFDLPEPVVQFDELGHMLTIARSERHIAHRLIEEFMLLANEQVARYLEEAGLRSLHRAHEKPDTKKVIEFEELARAFGYTLGLGAVLDRPVAVRHGRLVAQTRSGYRGRRERPMAVRVPLDIDIRPAHYQRLVEKIAGRPEERILSYLMLRSLKQARYAAEPIGHFALAIDFYTHFTSPIRRYPDLIVHRILKWALENSGEKALVGPYRGGELEEVATESSEAERRAVDAEREVIDWKTAEFMQQHLGEEYEAMIISVLKFGFFVELMEVFVEGLVPIDRIEETAGEPCFFREPDHAIVSRSRRRRFRLGDRVRVRAERIDPLFRRVEFAVISEA
ncbi:MAG TPA: VacB/RNase II family 3'-5' exoribonuclease [Candidatus Dormibacteraeota bacterium]|nr:VacB/RNase II family 3'-5' exoribonuclease [Candidatus Dormibacteraeota bacterium]